MAWPFLNLVDIEGSDDPLRLTMEQRWSARVPCRLDVWISAGPGVGGTARMRDVSLLGAFLESTLPLPLSAHIDVAVVRDGLVGRQGAIPAFVVREEPDGVGVQWSETSWASISALLDRPTR